MAFVLFMSIRQHKWGMSGNPVLEQLSSFLLPRRPACDTAKLAACHHLICIRSSDFKA